jgi:hypothetical protein
MAQVKVVSPIQKAVVIHPIASDMEGKEPIISNGSATGVAAQALTGHAHLFWD